LGAIAPHDVPNVDDAVKSILDGPPRIRVREAEQDGVYFIGLRRGLFLGAKPRLPVRGRRLQVMGRAARTFVGPTPDERYLDYSNEVTLDVFDTRCPNCRGRVRIDVARRLR